jgi:hypothetical protein
MAEPPADGSATMALAGGGGGGGGGGGPDLMSQAAQLQAAEAIRLQVRPCLKRV